MKRTIFLLLIMLFSGYLFAQNSTLKVGENAPEIALPKVDGTAFSLSSLKGRIVLIDFWATWCAPCVKEQPELKALYEKYANSVKNGKFEILGVSLDKSKENWQKTIERFKIDWLQVSDLKFWKSPVAKDYGIEGLPFNVLIDEQGKIIAINLHGKELEELVHKYLNVEK
ncbi:MAG: redoxin domain-containing protein [Sphingobacteriales bacterium]|uniref:TlpA family protein disulfide reductase n=1 Tax=Hydrotalea flava TaxID=714549 RepID=UPI00082B24F9|nr:TlpA disulfide reductase family protein [Hydrotalea flava]RTL52047.1 MAG: redoxin domain-containing protein [Sphingobacteriales bacterium]